MAQFDANVAAVSAPFDWVSAHLYAGNDNVRWNITDPNSPDSAACVVAVVIWVLGGG